jgi:hypothetical protein
VQRALDERDQRIAALESRLSEAVPAELSSSALPQP